MTTKQTIWIILHLSMPETGRITLVIIWPTASTLQSKKLNKDEYFQSAGSFYDATTKVELSQH